MTPAIIRNAGLGGTEYGVACTVRRRITQDHLRYVAANRHRLGWQTMANICGVNQSDLRKAWEAAQPAEAGSPPPAPETGEAAAATADPGIGRADYPIQALRAIERGAVKPIDISDACQVSYHHATRLVLYLKRHGLMAGDARSSRAGWIITARGHAALRRAARP